MAGSAYTSDDYAMLLWSPLFSLGFVQLGSDWIDLEKWVLIAM